MNALGAMLRGRGWILFGSLASLIASVGLVIFGPDVIRVFGIVSLRPGGPLDTSLEGLAHAAKWAAVFGVGVTLVTVGYLLMATHRVASAVGRWLLALHGVTTALGAVLILLGAWHVYAQFSLIAESETVTPQEVAAAMAIATHRGQVGFALLAIAQALLVAAGVAGFSDSRPRAGTLAGLRIFGLASALCALLFALLFVLAWQLHGQTLQQILADPDAAIRVDVFIRHLVAILRTGVLAALCLVMHGGFQAAMAFLLPRKMRVPPP